MATNEDNENVNVLKEDKIVNAEFIKKPFDEQKFLAELDNISSFCSNRNTYIC